MARNITRMKGSVSLVVMLIMLAAMGGGLYLVSKSQETRRGAYFAGTTVLLQPTTLTNKVGDQVLVSLFVDTGVIPGAAYGEKAKVDFVKTKLCFGNGLNIDVGDTSKVTINKTAFDEVLDLGVTGVGTGKCLTMSVRSTKEVALLQSGMVQVASIKLTAVSAESGNITIDKSATEVFGANPTTSSTDMSLEISSVSGSSYVIAPLVTPTNTPTATPTRVPPTNTPTNTPTATPTRVPPTITPTPTPSCKALNTACSGAGDTTCCSPYGCADSMYGFRCGVIPTSTPIPTATPTRVPPTPTVAPTCKECPSDFKCYVNQSTGEHLWFVTGYVQGGFVAETGTTCGGVLRPAFIGKIGGDANCDGLISGADYSVWRREYLDISQTQPIVRNTWEADFTGLNGKCDGLVSGYDYSLWRRAYRN